MNDEKNAVLEIEQKKADIEQTKASTSNLKEQNKETVVQNKVKAENSKEATKGRSPAEEERERALADKNEEKKYTRLEQKQHEKTRVGSTKRSEKLAKTQNKAV